MKNRFSISLIWVAIFALTANTFAQDFTQSDLPEGAKARLDGVTINEIVYAPDGKHLVIASGNEIWFYDAQTGKKLNALIGHTDMVGIITFSPDGKTLMSGGSDGTVHLWDIATNSKIRTLTPQTGAIGAAFSPDGSTLASGNRDGIIRLWDVATDSEIRTLAGHVGWVNTIAFSPDSKTLTSGGSDQTVRLWDVATGNEIYTLKGHKFFVISIALSPDGKTVASGSAWGEGYLRLWNVATGNELQTLTTHKDAIVSVAFSPDSKTLATGSRDQTVRLWDVATGDELRILTAHNAPIISVAFSPDGKTLASSGDVVLLWELHPDEEPAQLAEDVNKDGIVNILDLTLVASNFGKSGENDADVNADGIVNILDLTLVAAAFGNIAAAP